MRLVLPAPALGGAVTPRRLPTLSGLQLLAACPGSGSLEHRRWCSDRADLGSALHEVQEWRIRGVEPQADVIACRWGLDGEAADELARLADSFRPDVPQGALAEVALGLFEDGHVERVEGGRGEYEALPGLLVAGTLDAIWSEPGMSRDELDNEHPPRCHPAAVLWVTDWKLSAYSPPIARNLQLRAGALLAARWTGARRVIPAICEMTPGPGTWDVGEVLGPAELDAVEAELRALLAAATEESPRFVVGPHCETCDARWACPVQVTEARALLSHVDRRAGALTTDEAAKLATMLPTARGALRAAEEALKAHVRATGPIELPGGKVYALEVEEIESYDAGATVAAVEGELGAAAVGELFPATITKSAIYDAIEAAGVTPKKAAFGRIRAGIEAAGGVTTKTREIFRARWPGSAG